MSKRVESGVVQFGDDWPGVFFRGDDAYAQAIMLRTVAGVAGSPSVLVDLAEDLEAAEQRNLRPDNVQHVPDPSAVDRLCAAVEAALAVHECGLCLGTDNVCTLHGAKTEACSGCHPCRCADALAREALRAALDAVRKEKP